MLINIIVYLSLASAHGPVTHTEISINFALPCLKPSSVLFRVSFF